MGFKDNPYNLFAFKDLFEALRAIEEEERKIMKLSMVKAIFVKYP
jgi:hypothetical protein